MLTTAAAAPAGLRSLAAALYDTARRVPDRPAFTALDQSVALTWSQTAVVASEVAGGLSGLGVKRGETVGLMTVNRPEFNLADLGAVTLGAVPFSIYATSSVEQVAHLLRDATPRVLIADRQFLPVVQAARQLVPGVEHVVCVDGPDEAADLDLMQLRLEGRGFDAEAAAAAIGPDDLLALVYTSGTTGPPKGVEVSHANVLATVASMTQVIPQPAHPRLLSWLPTAHMAERAAHYYTAVLLGASVTTCPDSRDVLTALRQVRPTWFFAVPRVWEKLKAGLEAHWQLLPDAQRAAVDADLHTSLARVAVEQAGQSAPPAVLTGAEEADRRSFAPLRAMVGLDRATAVNVASAPCAEEVVGFFHALGLPLSELWGMSETCAGGTANPTGAVRIGTVGPAAPGMQVRLADDGELLVTGPSCVRGYRNRPQETAELIDPDGWLHTGDLAQIDPDGYVRIVGRKKELIINAAGKNMSPTAIEAAVTLAAPLVAHAVAIGDQRPYNVALLTLDPDALAAWARGRGMTGSTAELASSDALTHTLADALTTANRRLSRAEQIKRFTVVTEAWDAGGPLLTPTLKLRRRPIAVAYAELIDDLYAKRAGTEVVA